VARELVLVEPVIVRTNEALDAALAELEGAVALDTEFHSEHRYYPRLMLIQLRDRAGRIVLIDALAPIDLGGLCALDGREIIAHAPSQDLLLLQRHAGWKPGRVLDTQTLAGFCGHGWPRSLADLVAEVLGGDVGPTYSLSDWSKRPLPEEQLRYAIADVAFLHRLCDVLVERAGPEGVEACQELARGALVPSDPSRAWRGIPAAEILSERGRSALQGLAAWRETTARTQDQPPFQVASNAVLVDLARRRPSSVGEMTRNRRFPRRLAKRHADVILAICARARGSEVYDHPARVRRDVVARALDSWAAELELREGLAARLALPLDLRRDVTDRLLAQEPIGLEGWRSHRVAPQLSRFVIGLKSLE